jgi:hypothetical protein
MLVDYSQSIDRQSQPVTAVAKLPSEASELSLENNKDRLESIPPSSHCQRPSNQVGSGQWRAARSLLVVSCDRRSPEEVSSPEVQSLRQGVSWVSALHLRVSLSS